MSNPALKQALSKIRWRILPFVALMFAMAIIDRSNIGFAKHAFQADTGLSNAAFALGAGIFFIGYAVFEVPSNLMLHKIGARIWLSRIMVTWGLVSAAMMFAHDETSFYILRFLLGVAEAGLSPGVVLYLTYWFPQNQRGSAYGIYYFGVPVSLMVGGPVSGWLLETAQFGLTGWQWMFVTEGLAASIIGVFAFFYLTDKPRDAKWLSTEEKAAIEHELEKEQLLKANKGPSSWRAALIACMTLGAAALLLLYPELITNRGSSFRFDPYSLRVQPSRSPYRSTFPGSGSQPVPGLRCPGHGRPGRYPEQNPPRRCRRQKLVRPAA